MIPHIHLNGPTAFFATGRGGIGILPVTLCSLPVFIVTHDFGGLQHRWQVYTSSFPAICLNITIIDTFLLSKDLNSSIISNSSNKRSNNKK
jgi:hypothetical protein